MQLKFRAWTGNGFEYGREDLLCKYPDNVVDQYLGFADLEGRDVYVNDLIVFGKEPDSVLGRVDYGPWEMECEAMEAAADHPFVGVYVYGLSALDKEFAQGEFYVVCTAWEFPSWQGSTLRDMELPLQL